MLRTSKKPAGSRNIRKVNQTFNFIFLLAAVTLTVFRVCCFQQLSLIVVGTGFLFSFAFHWGTVEPVSPSTGTRRKEQEQGTYSKRVKILLSALWYRTIYHADENPR